MWNRALASCSEFPNDNPQLHRGAIWLCLEVTGAASCERPLAAEATPVELSVTAEPEADDRGVPEEQALPEVMVAVADGKPIVDSDSDRDLDPDLAPDVDLNPDHESDSGPPQPIAEPASAAAEPTTDPSPPVLEADDASDDIEIVEEIVLENVVDESIPPPPPPAADDPFVALVAVLEETARSVGASASAMSVLRTLLGRERIAEDATADLSELRAQAAGWQAILRGESEDFSLVGSSALDEWSSNVIARALGEPSRADGLRRELRRRGVAAFGLIVEAA